ncbi:MAG: ABC transporter permease [Aurantimonas endophytica]|uniref:NitT/TauT family transport system permease protein n=1 Tax=Aurantimonas endophytica TaxID=1522175 RepID=A0A7W6MRI5_9HYPH|nr:ABC transporter permease [Aurantimonas endophytica]MBB4005013.1 NitT/TauT family transport system permease protein [Aurantimonas endophytica]MCO6405819.1 ABC transporter permease subunit [Aurantimonas endophytica]
MSVVQRVDHRPVAIALNAALAGAAGLYALSLLDGGSGRLLLAVALGFWLLAWRLTASLAALEPKGRAARAAIDITLPVLFGLTLLLLWEIVVRGLDVPSVLLPPPSAIGAQIAGSLSILWADFRQTFLKAVIAGYVLGCGAGFVVAVLVDRSPFLKRGLLPIGNLVSALPIIGVAPIMVMWFGFDWQSKAAVVVVMTFFPMLVNTVAGLQAAGAMERDLMRTYAASPWQGLLKLRLPAALPFIFNALKINTTLALIGAIVAEFFGTPIVGMGFRISAEIGRMNTPMVWAEITVAALAGSLSYGLVAMIERWSTFWHPSYRKG